MSASRAGTAHRNLRSAQQRRAFEQSPGVPSSKAWRDKRCARDVLVQPPGSKVSMTTNVDSSLVAGITIEIGDKFIDLSVASQIKRLQTLLN